MTGFLVYRKIKYKPYKQQNLHANPLVRDSAITNQNEDFFGYQKMVDSLLADLYDTDVEYEAFRLVLLVNGELERVLYQSSEE